MKKAIILSLGLIPVMGYTQNLHADLFGGIATYQGDLQGKRISLNQSHPAVGLGVSYNLSDKFIVRTGFTYAVIEGSDKKSSGGKDITARNLSFKSAVSELHLGLEYNLFRLEGRSLTPYVFAGVAGYHFNPYAKDATGNKVFLKPLSTEGQGLAAYPDKKEYKLTQFAIPFGAGIKFKISDDLQLGVEVGLRKLFTDYIDDVSDSFVDATILATAKGPKAVELAFREDEINPSATYPAAGAQRGNPKSNDFYYFSGIRLSKTINGNGGNGNGTGCPRSVF